MLFQYRAQARCSMTMIIPFIFSACRFFCLFAGAMLVLGGCAPYDKVTGAIANAMTPYRINIVQGNFVSREAAAQLHAGMTRDQARALLGTPLLTDIFHADRWDYIFYFKQGNTPVVQQRKLTLYFKNNRLMRWEGGENLPTEYQLVREIDGQKSKKSVRKQRPNVSRI
jgi:outer membrane protein assembly factor BamE